MWTVAVQSRITFSGHLPPMMKAAGVAETVALDKIVAARKAMRIKTRREANGKIWPAIVTKREIRSAVITRIAVGVAWIIRGHGINHRGAIDDRRMNVHRRLRDVNRRRGRRGCGLGFVLNGWRWGCCRGRRDLCLRSWRVGMLQPGGDDRAGNSFIVEVDDVVRLHA